MLKKIRLHRHDFTYATPRERPATGASQKRNAVTKIKFYPQRSAQNEKEKTQMLHQQKKNDTSACPNRPPCTFFPFTRPLTTVRNSSRQTPRTPMQKAGAPPDLMWQHTRPSSRKGFTVLRKSGSSLAQKQRQPCAQKNRAAGIAFCRDAEQTNRYPCEKCAGTHLKCFYILTK